MANNQGNSKGRSHNRHALDGPEFTPDLAASREGGKGTSSSHRKTPTGEMADAAINRRRSARRPEERVSVPWTDNLSPDVEPFRQAVDLGPATTCALLLIRAALLQTPGFLERAMEPGTVSVFHLPDKEWGQSLVEAWSLVVKGRARQVSTPRGDSVADASSRRLARAHAGAGEAHHDEENLRQVVAIEGTSWARRSAIDRSDAVNMYQVTHAFSPDPDAMLPPDVILAEDQRLTILPPDSEVVGLLALALSSEGGWPSAQEVCMPAAISASASTVTPSVVNLARRPGQTSATYLQRLAEFMVKRDFLVTKGKERKGITLDDLPGLGAAAEWGQQVAADLQAYAAGTLSWSEVDRGVVLEGPPGTGKSSFARALSNSAGAAFISASLAQWQGDRDGHLGTLCAAMRRSFEEARRRAPCVLLIDEVDAFPTRTSVRHAHRDYTVQVVNALLEQLDGAVDRTGVLVIATCNDSSGLDPALIRSGRLEQVVRLERPDEEGLVDIARVYLAGSLADADLKPLAMVAHRRGAVGADIEHWCRGARRRARTAGRSMLLEDLIEEIGEAPPMHGSEAIWRMAVHEAGHVLACAMLDPSSIREVVVDPAIGGRSATIVDPLHLFSEIPHATRAQARAQLRAALAGRAAEEIILGEPSGGSGGSAASDLAKATKMAGLEVVSSGLEEHPEGLLYLGDADDHRRLEHLLLLPEIRQRVAVVLRDAYADTLDLVRRHRAGVERVAAALVNRGSLSGEEAGALLGSLKLEDDAR